MARQHIILAGSRPNLQHSLSLMLKQAEYRVSLAGTTEEALSLAEAWQDTPEATALLIVDLDSASPEASRTDMQSLAASTPAIPYLVLTGDLRNQTAEDLKKHGCLACITKPFEPTTLLRSIHDALDRLPSLNEPQPGRRPEQSSPENPVNQPG